jgi:hypothetical protein
MASCSVAGGSRAKQGAIKGTEGDSFESIKGGKLQILSEGQRMSVRLRMKFVRAPRSDRMSGDGCIRSCLIPTLRLPPFKIMLQAARRAR